MQRDKYVRFLYATLENGGRLKFSYESGWVSTIYRNGDFILTDGYGLGPRRYCQTAIV